MAPAENVLILGGAGMLGTAMTRLVRQRRIGHTRLTRRELDLAALDSIDGALRETAPSAVINASSFTDVRAAEQPERREEAFLINRDSARVVARACHAMGVPLIHVSTDYVFDGQKREPYREDDPTAPLQAYGRSKLEGEHAVREEHPDALIARTSTLFGPGEQQRRHYVDAILRQARERGVLKVVELPVSSPTYTPDLAEALLDLLGSGATGIVHVVNSGQCSRLELARATVEEAGLADKVTVDTRPQPSAGAPRPAYSVLDTSRLRSLIGRPLRPWREALRAYLEEIRD